MSYRMDHAGEILGKMTATDDSSKIQFLSGKYVRCLSPIQMVGSQSHVLRFKMILLGEAGVGKSTFMRALLKSEKLSRHSSSMDFIHAETLFQYRDKKIQLDIEDTAGLERYRSLTASYYRHADGCILFFNVHNNSSFEKLQEWIKDIKRYRAGCKTATILVGLTHKLNDGTRRKATNPVDEQTGMSDANKAREVPKERAAHRAHDLDLPYREINSLDQHEDLVEAVRPLLDQLLSNLRNGAGKSESLEATFIGSVSGKHKKINLSQSSTKSQSSCC